MEEVSEGIFYIPDGDIFRASEDAVIVNTVNCAGVMGAGLAKKCKEQYPEMFLDYQRKCKRGQVRIGFPYLYAPEQGRTILNFPTKDHYRNPSQIKFIQEGLQYFADKIDKKEWEIKHIVFPPLGCGLGGLEWSVVFPVMLEHLGPLGKKGIRIEICGQGPVPTSTSTLKSSSTGPMDQYVLRIPGENSIFSSRRKRSLTQTEEQLSEDVSSKSTRLNPA